MVEFDSRASYNDVWSLSPNSHFVDKIALKSIEAMIIPSGLLFDFQLGCNLIMTLSVGNSITMDQFLTPTYYWKEEWNQENLGTTSNLTVISNEEIR